MVFSSPFLSLSFCLYLSLLVFFLPFHLPPLSLSLSLSLSFYPATACPGDGKGVPATDYATIGNHFITILQNLPLIWHSFIFFICFFTGEVVHLVGFSVGYRSSDMHPRVQYQCYRSTVDLDATLEFGRYISTRSNETELPSLMSHSKKQAAVKVIRFKGNLRDQAYGVFYCRGSKVGREPTPVLSFFIRSDGKMMIPVRLLLVVFLAFSQIWSPSRVL